MFNEEFDEEEYAENEFDEGEYEEDDGEIEDDDSEYEEGETEEGDEGYYDEGSGAESEESDGEVAEEPRNEAIMAEYERVFTGEERTAASLKISSDAFTRVFKRIKLSEIVIPEPLKGGRADTMTGLTAITKDLGVLVPIHVKALPEDQQDEECKYALLDGLRRVFGAMKNGQESVDAVVWEFTDDEVGSEYALLISMLLNRTQERSWGEKWDLLQTLEMQSAVKPDTLEFLLSMKPGEAMKLKDIMLSPYGDVKNGLLTGTKTLEQAYKLLTKYRKELDALKEEDEKGLRETLDGAETMAANNVGGKGQLSDEDVRSLLDMSKDLDVEDDDGSVDFKDLSDSNVAEQQKVGERHPLDPAIRQSVLARDSFTCACCGIKMIGARLGTIAVHHKIPVHCGGRDQLDNLVTLCVNCHVALHVMERMGGSILMSEEDWNSLYVKGEDDKPVIINGKPKMSPEQISLLKARKLALIAIEADKRQGKSRDAVYDATSEALKHPMPNVAFSQGKSDYIAAGMG